MMLATALYASRNWHCSTKNIVTSVHHPSDHLYRTSHHVTHKLTSGHQFSHNKQRSLLCADPIEFHQTLMLELPIIQVWMITSNSTFFVTDLCTHFKMLIASPRNWSPATSRMSCLVTLIATPVPFHIPVITYCMG